MDTLLDNPATTDTPTLDFSGGAPISPLPRQLHQVYRYGLLPPTVEAERVATQMSAAHTYYNKLIELERARRVARDKVMAVSPLAECLVKIATLETELQTERAALKAARAEARSRQAGDPARIKTIFAELRDLNKTRKAALKIVQARPEIQAALAPIDAATKAAVRAARSGCEVYWGTYLPIEAAVEAAKASPLPPKFKRWTGDGAVSVQLQKGLPVENLFAGVDSRVRLSLACLPVPGRGGRPLPRLQLRIDSNGRAPVWAEWPIIYHRPLPENAVIKWAKVLRRQVASHVSWSLHLTLERPSVPPVAPVADTLAVNLRWAKSSVGDGSITLVADWHDGDTGGAVWINPAIVSRAEKSSDLQSIRDKNFESVKTTLRGALKVLSAPEEHIERLSHLHAWKAQGKLAAHSLWWREHRFPGDEEIFLQIEAWRKQDKHLWEWEANNRQKALARRRDNFRVFAAQTSRRYSTLVIEHLNIARLAEIPAPESENDSSPQARAQRFMAAPSELRLALVQAFKREGRRIVEIPAGMSSAEMILYFREHGGDESAPAPARSLRFNRLRKIKPAE